MVNSFFSLGVKFVQRGVCFFSLLVFQCRYFQIFVIPLPLIFKRFSVIDQWLLLRTDTQPYFRLISVVPQRRSVGLRHRLKPYATSYGVTTNGGFYSFY